MSDRFNLNEEEKNRIRGLHNINVINENKVVNENIGMKVMNSIDEETPNVTRIDYDGFITCLEDYNIDKDVMFNAENFVRAQMASLGKDVDGQEINDSKHPSYYTLKMGLIGWNLVKNGYDMYNRRSSEPSTCAMDMMNKFGIGDVV
tara:strand:+ start:9989 stop:10429 length:441 start_codon:yes stop_codon:yes gene_type:complete